LNINLIDRIQQLKQERKAVILVHNYQLGEVQDIADYTGDSLELSRIAAESNAEVIVFCGVHFMAETASILCPDKKVLLPDLAAGCAMADMVTVDELQKAKDTHPNAPVVCYVNSTAAIKALSYVCCTSANAVDIVNHIDSDEVLFVPDQNLGKYVAMKTGKHVIFWSGYCPAHVRIRPDDVIKCKQDYPNVAVVVHPECTPQVIALADEVLSTGGMVRYAARNDVQEMIVGTEIGMLYRLKKENPGKRFIPVSEQAVCPDMKLITLEKVAASLEKMAPEVKVPEDIRRKAKTAVDRMLEVKHSGAED
jgi:quinolinate synthase